MASTGSNESERRRFVPRFTFSLLGGVLLFGVVAGLYVLPVLLDPTPPGAIPDYRKERVMARLEGKVTWMLGGSLFVAMLLGARGQLASSGDRR